MSVNGNSLRAAFAKSVSDHWVLFLVEGIVLLVLGFLAMVIPPLATLAVTILLGWLFLISGIVGLFTTFWARHAPGFWWSLLSAALGIGAGLVLLAWPVGGAVSLTLVLIVFFLIEGIASIMYALEHRQQLSGHGRSDRLSASTCSSAVRRLLRWPCTPAHAGVTRRRQLCDRCGKNSPSGGCCKQPPTMARSVGGD